MIQMQAHDRVAGSQGRKKNGLVRLGAGVRLNIHMVAMKKLLGAVAGKVFDHINELAAAIVSLAGIPFRVLIA